MTHDTTSRILREPEACRYIGMSIPWMRQARGRGDGPAYLRIGRAIRFRIADLDAWLEAHRIDPSARSGR
jgi:predicted DNA-binding transcriptional regulator AlpA